MKPTVGISLSNHNLAAEMFRIVRELGMRPLLYDHNDPTRWNLLTSQCDRDSVVCIVDDDPQMIIAATALGFHAVVYQPPDYFRWHLSIDGDDAKTGLAYRYKEWRDKHASHPA